MARDPFTTETPPGASSAPGEGSDEQPQPNGYPKDIGDAFNIAGEKFRAVGDYASLYVSLKIDQILASVRKIGIFAGLGVVALVVAAGLLVTATVLVCVGIAEGLTQLFGGRVWLGDLVTGLLILLSISLVIYIFVSRIFSAARNNTVKKYEARKREQQSK